MRVGRSPDWAWGPSRKSSVSGGVSLSSCPVMQKCHGVRSPLLAPLALWMLSQAGHEFKATLSYIKNPVQKCLRAGEVEQWIKCLLCSMRYWAKLPNTSVNVGHLRGGLFQSQCLSTGTGIPGRSCWLIGLINWQTGFSERFWFSV